MAEGTFDINLPLAGEPGVECRSSGGNQALVFTFRSNVVSSSASVTAVTGNVSGNPIFAENTMTVNLRGVTCSTLQILTRSRDFYSTAGDD